jgi:protein translocase SecG subunit
VEILRIILLVLLGITSLLLTLLILLHKGRGGGMSDMFGGGMTTSMGSSGVAERNLNRRPWARLGCCHRGTGTDPAFRRGFLTPAAGSGETGPGPGAAL